MQLKATMILVAAGLALAGCGTSLPGKDYTAFRQAAPRSVLVVPVINYTGDAEVADRFLATLPMPLAERGYYVFPASMVKKQLELNGLSKPYQIHKADTRQLASLFNADSVLYVEALNWMEDDRIPWRRILVRVLYTLKDGRSGALLWQDERYYRHDLPGDNNLAQVVAPAIASVTPNGPSDYASVALATNAVALHLPGKGVPHGPYSPMYEKDAKQFPDNPALERSNAEISAISAPMDDKPTAVQQMLRLGKQRKEGAEE